MLIAGRELARSARSQRASCGTLAAGAKASASVGRALRFHVQDMVSALMFTSAERASSGWSSDAGVGVAPDLAFQFRVPWVATRSRFKLANGAWIFGNTALARRIPGSKLSPESGRKMRPESGAEKSKIYPKNPINP